MDYVRNDRRRPPFADRSPASPVEIDWPLVPDRSASLGSLSSEASTTSLQKPQVPLRIPRAVSDELFAKGLVVDKYGVVRWHQSTRRHPRRWPVYRKAYDSAIICMLEFFVTMVSNTGSSVAESAMVDFHMGRVPALLCFTTVYLLGQAIGGLIFPPIAESFGGRTIYVTSALGYGVLCLFMAVWPIVSVVVVGRFLTGLLSAMPAVVAAGSIENMWDSKARIWVVNFWMSAAVSGLALGPAIASYLCASSYGWSFIFYISAAVCLGFTLLCLGMQESRPSQLLRNHLKIVAQTTSFDGLTTDEDSMIPAFKDFVKVSLSLPVKLFFTEPIVFLTSLMAATVVAVVYLFSEALNTVYIDGYGFSVEESASVFLALAVGIPFTFLTRLYDIRVSNLCGKNMKQLEPEHKLFGFYIGAPVLAVAFWWFAWTIPPLVQGVSPWVSICSLFFVGFSVVEFNTVLSGYLTDTYAAYAGSANAPMAFLRAILSGVFPLFGHILFEDLGANYALFILASVATLFCGVAVLFGMYGRRIRLRSPFAAKTCSEPETEPEPCPEMGTVRPPTCPEKCLPRSLPNYI